MKTEQITIDVDADTAKAYRDAPAEMRKKIDALLSLEIEETVCQDEASLKEIMDQLSKEAKNSGQSPERLQSILDE